MNISDNYNDIKVKKADNNLSAFSINPTFEIEQDLIENGYEVIAGVDEAGRGALAGPLSVGLVIYHKSFIQSLDNKVNGIIKDSKKIPEKKRIAAANLVKESSIVSAVSLISHKIIDKININSATEFALNKLLKSIDVKPDVVIMDGNFSFNLDIKYIPVLKGDMKSISIASASILAKVKRDQVIEKLDSVYPGYGFKKNKGYGTKEHRDAISDIGFSKIHRRSYEPVKSIINSLNEIDE